MNVIPEAMPIIVHKVGLGGTTDRKTAHIKTDPKLNNTAPVVLYIIFASIVAAFIWSLVYMYEPVPRRALPNKKFVMSFFGKTLMTRLGFITLTDNAVYEATPKAGA